MTGPFTTDDATSRGLSGRMLAVPGKMADAARAFLRAGSAPPAGSAIRVPPLSLDWLRDHELYQGKH